MTKREAALILGVRESASIDRIKDAHRRILINNHPDRGGSPFIAAKVNEAKDFLLKGNKGSSA
jgi:curved DNA-binding protein CbpA